MALEYLLVSIVAFMVSLGFEMRIQHAQVEVEQQLIAQLDEAFSPSALD